MIRAILSLEFRNVFSYRADFWISFLGGLFSELLIAFFLWGSIYSAKGVTELNGYTFKAMMLYYVFVSFILRMVRGRDFGLFSRDIYGGQLNRYLVYPYSIFLHKFAIQIVEYTIALVQLVITVAIFLLLFGIAEDISLRPLDLSVALIFSFLSCYLYFTMTASLDLVAFWTDTVWSLLVMLRFLLLFFGGGMIPLAFFPEATQPLVRILPFKYVLGFPIECAMGRTTPNDWIFAVTVLMFWALIGSGVLRFIWQKGLRQYSGIGI